MPWRTRLTPFLLLLFCLFVLGADAETSDSSGRSASLPFLAALKDATFLASSSGQGTTRDWFISRVSGSLVYILLVCCVAYLVRQWPEREHPHFLRKPVVKQPPEPEVEDVSETTLEFSCAGAREVPIPKLAKQESSSFQSFINVLACRRGAAATAAFEDQVATRSMSSSSSAALPKGMQKQDDTVDAGSGYVRLTEGELRKQCPNEFYFGLCDGVKGEDTEVCACAYLCTPVKWAETIDDDKVQLADFWRCLLAAAVCWSILGPLFFIPIAVHYRQKLRAKFGMESKTNKTYLEDCLSWTFCSCCAALQEARQVMYLDPLDEPKQP